ncbi:hypothetical protein BAAA27673_01425 [Bifidobacterium animalis subsp. lactis ATCC 27673]|nr:hypothetical protein BAAA27673_01425 [Bifidobacterium animalis subsp. lactis ATCC 27673]
MLRLVKHYGDVFVHTGALAETTFIATPCELLGFLTVRFPLIGPDGFKITGGRHFEFWMCWIMVSVQAEAESTYASE